IMTGTSMSSPFVSGVAALVRATYPSLTQGQAVAQILNGAMPIFPYQGYTATDNQAMGSGRLDALAALGALRFTHVGNTSLVSFDVTTTSQVITDSLTLSSKNNQQQPCELLATPCVAEVPTAQIQKGTFALTLHNTNSNTVVGLQLKSTNPGL